MTGIYSGLPPTHELPREPINAMRSRQGLRPLCYDRPDYPAEVEVNMRMVPIGLGIYGQATMLVPNPMTSGCKSWAVREPDEKVPGDAGEDPAVESIPARESWRCWGCRHLPSDPRVIAKAKEIEAA